LKSEIIIDNSEPSIREPKLSEDYTKNNKKLKSIIKLDYKIKKMEIVSDNSDTESKIDEDNLFDIDSNDSELDAPVDDGGGLSD
jgi:hypothetical protein